MPNRVPGNERGNRRETGEHKAVAIKTSHFGSAEKAIKPAAQQSSPAGHRDAHLGIITSEIKSFAGNEPDDETQSNPAHSSKEHVALQNKEQGRTQPA